MSGRMGTKVRWAGVAALLLIGVMVVPLLAGDGEIGFVGSRVLIFYQPPLRSGAGEAHALAREIPRLNLLTNLLDNYLLYLERLGKIASETMIKFEYSPEGDGTMITKGRVLLPEIGLNAALTTVNGILRKGPQTRERFLIEEAGSLFSIRDQLPRREGTVEAGLNFTNLSDRFQRLEPESDFVMTGDREVIAVRPQETANIMVRLRADASGTVFLPKGQRDYEELQVSADRRFLAFTEGGDLRMASLASGAPVNLFPPAEKTLLGMRWSPVGATLAGIVLDRATARREIFIYEADRQEFRKDLPGQESVDGDFQYAYPYWSPDGRRLFFTSGNDLNLFDLGEGKVIAKVVDLVHPIAEVVWSQDSQSFALVEVEGQSRSKVDFDDADFQGSILRRFRLGANGVAVQDPNQQHLSSHTIKLVGFWTLDRVLFLEGHLESQRTLSHVWKLTDSFSARLTPTPDRRGILVPASGPASIETGFIDLPRKFCHVVKSLDGKFRNCYDAGYGHMNHQYLDRVEYLWLVGLRLPEGYPPLTETYNLRPSPFPFPERNIVICQDYPQQKLDVLLDYVESYNIRSLTFAPDAQAFCLLSNSRGPLTVWSGRFEDIQNLTLPKPADEEETLASSLNDLPFMPGSNPASEPSGGTSPGGAPAGTLPSLPSLPGWQTPEGSPKDSPGARPGEGALQSLPSFPGGSAPGGALPGLPDLPGGSSAPPKGSTQVAPAGTLPALPTLPSLPDSGSAPVKQGKKPAKGKRSSEPAADPAPTAPIQSMPSLPD